MALLPSLMLLAALSAQPHVQQPATNPGLLSPQDPSDLPVSAAPRPVCSPVEYVEPSPAVCNASCSLDDGWTLYSSDRSRCWNAVVPGTVLTTLVAAGEYPDPYYGLNNMYIPEDLCRSDWWYSRPLRLSPEALSAGRIELLFEGINYCAEVFVGGKFIGAIRGAFARGRFDITPFVGPENEISVHILPPPNPGIPHEQSVAAGAGPNGGQLCKDGPTFISSEGWDWVPGIRDRNIGIWQDVSLIVSSGVTLGDARVVTDLPLPSTRFADVSVDGALEGASGPLSVVAYLRGRKVGKCQSSAEGTYSLDFRLKHPRLWMPAGYGDPNLYDLTLKVYDGDRQLDSKTVRFGVREFSYELTVDTPSREGVRILYDPTDLRAQGYPFNNRLLRSVGDGVEVPSLAEGFDESLLTELPSDGMGPYLVVRCNGVRILCRGGNWGMDDAMKDCSRAHLEPYFRLHLAEGFNMIRNWTGESTEETFYELCDEYGMLVWNDFWLSTESYNLDVDDEDLFIENVAETVLRFRNHPSIAVWCPRNEGYATESLEKRLSAVLSELDGTRQYHPNSRYCCLRPSGPWHYREDVADYSKALVRGFNTEMGTISVPPASSVRKFIAPEDEWPLGDVWKYHDLHNSFDNFAEIMARRYGAPAGLDDFCSKAQLMEYDAFRAIFEALNQRMWRDCSGLLLWMSHPAWPSVVWQTYSWDCETFGSFYGCRKACEPLHIQMVPSEDNIYKVAVVNTDVSRRSCLKASARSYSPDGRKTKKADARLAFVAANTSVEAFAFEALSELSLVRLTLRNRWGRVVSLNDYLLAPDGDFRSLPSVSADDISLKIVKSRRSAAPAVRRSSVSASSVAPAVRRSSVSASSVAHAASRSSVCVSSAAPAVRRSSVSASSVACGPSASGPTVRFVARNRSRSAAVCVRFAAEDAASGERLLPAVFSDSCITLLPGERRRLSVTLPAGSSRSTLRLLVEG